MTGRRDGRNTPVKYLILIYGNRQNREYSIEEDDRQTAKFDAFYDELKASGKMLAGTPLAPAETTRTITQRNGFISITDGPFAEAKEQLAGIVLADCETIEEAYDIGRNFLEAENISVEIRPVAV